MSTPFVRPKKNESIAARLGTAALMLLPIVPFVMPTGAHAEKTKIEGRIHFNNQGNGWVQNPDGSWGSPGNDIHMQTETRIKEPGGYEQGRRTDTELSTGRTEEFSGEGYPYKRRADVYEMESDGYYHGRHDNIFQDNGQAREILRNKLFTCNDPAEQLVTDGQYFFCKGYSQTPMRGGERRHGHSGDQPEQRPQGYGQGEGYGRRPSAQPQPRW